MKKFLFILISIGVVFSATCGNISIQTAKRVATNFYFERCPQDRNIDYHRIDVAHIFQVPQLTPLYYICAMNTGGFVIVSAADNIVPVLAYSFDSPYDHENPPCGFTSWMKHYEDQIRFAINSGIPAPANVSDDWARLKSANPDNLKDLRSQLSVSPLLVSKWNQGTPYNAMCPADEAGPGGHCYAGCVATAMGQLLYYYRHPNQGIGSYSYYLPDYDTISADFGATTYEWDAMPSSLLRENDAVATLLFHLGVSVDMDYGPDGSGMWNHKAAYSLRTYFGYGPETQYYFRDSIALDWDSILIVNLDQRKPLYYAGWAGVNSDNGHAFVCDGYQSTDYFHFNWGWGGTSDGYFYLDNLTPSGSNFNYAQEVIPMFPDTIASTYPPFCSGYTTLSTLDGSVEDGSGWYSYQPNTNCSWMIKPTDVEHDSVKNIKIKFNAFETNTSDSVVVYDGDTVTAPILASFSGNTVPDEITSGGDKLLVTFTSDNTSEASGWIADFRSTLPVYCSGQTTLTAPSGSFSDGSGNKRYNNGSVCRWRIEPAGAQYVTLWFTSFSLADTIDKVVITNMVTHELIAEYTGNEIPPPVMAEGGKLLLFFVTNSTGTGEGWDASYTTSAVGIDKTDISNFEATLAPNPAKESTDLYFYAENNGIISLQIKALSGKTISTWEILPKSGMNKVNISLENLPAAIYFLSITTKNNQETLKLIVN